MPFASSTLVLVQRVDPVLVSVVHQWVQVDAYRAEAKYAGPSAT